MSRGRTSRGTPVEVDAETEGMDAFLAVSDVKHHYFAGYSNPVKSFLPGLCSFETARANHSLALDPGAAFGHHPWHPEAARQDNPLAEDLVEGMQLILGERPAYAVATVTRARPPPAWL